LPRFKRCVRRLPWFWFFFTVAVLLLSAIDRYHIVSQFKQRERVVIIDPAGTYYLSPLLQFSEARDLHVQQAELATMAFIYALPGSLRVCRINLWGVHPIVRCIQKGQLYVV
jgi:hypothetical protein